MVKILLWLDDYRNPFKQPDWLVFSPIPQPFRTVWVKSYKEFVDYIQVFGIPDAICFDHDLAAEHYTANTHEALADYYKNKDREMTGYDAAKWLCEYCESHNEKIPLYSSQSANPVGRENIKSYIENFKKFNSENSSAD